MESRHESPRSCAGALGKGRQGFPQRPPPPGESHHGTVYGEMPGKSITRAASPDPPYRGYHRHCPRPLGGGGARSAGGVGVHESSVWV